MWLVRLVLGWGGKVKLYIGLAFAFAAFLGAFALSNQSKGKTTERVNRMKGRLKAIKHKKEVVKDVKSRTDDDLIDGITRRK